MASCEPGNLGYALDEAGSMADSDRDMETEGLEVALDTLCRRYCGLERCFSSKDYCSAFCQLVEEYTGQWHVPLPQLKVLRTALSNFTKATAAFPEDCQHIHYVLSSMALSFFELMLFFSKEEFVEEPLKDILDSFQRCHTRLLRHRNIYLQHLKHVIKAGGPWENPVLQGLLKQKDMPLNEIEDYLSSELPIFLELRVRYLQACERIQEAMALSKSCLENREARKHLFFHQAYLTCLYKASLYENFHKEMAEIDGRDAVEIICNTERVEKDELLLSLCNAFLTQQLHNGDMYYIWDLVFIWSRLHLRAYPSRQGFLAECLDLASSATNVRAIFPFIKLLTSELGAEGVQVCVELCARALQLCDTQADTVAQSLVCKTIAFLLPHDLEICRACALLVFCQERSLEAYRTVCLLYRHPDQEPHPHNNPVPTSIRFYIFQMLKERLCFDPEFWNLLTLRTRCVELMNDTVVKAAVLNEMKEEEEKEQEEEYKEEPIPNTYPNESSTQEFSSYHNSDPGFFTENLQEKRVILGEERRYVAPPKKVKKRHWSHRLRKRKQSYEELDYSDDPEFTFNCKSSYLRTHSMYSLRGSQTETSGKVPMANKREHLSRFVKSQIFNRKGRKSRWLQGIQRQDQAQTLRDKKGIVRGKKRGRKPFLKLELSYPDNEIPLTECGFKKKPESEDKELDVHQLESGFEVEKKQEDVEIQQLKRIESEPSNVIRDNILSEIKQEESQTLYQISEHPPDERPPAVEADPELDGSPLELVESTIELWHNYCNTSGIPDVEHPLETNEFNGTTNNFRQKIGTNVLPTEVKVAVTWKERSLRTQKYGHLSLHCNVCNKVYKGLNVMRHALSHLKRRKMKCILCGKRFKQHSIAKKHILDHIDAMCKQKCQEKLLPEMKPPAANGTIENVADQSQPQPRETPNPKLDIPEQKKKFKSLLADLSREQRIIRNIRTLIKKTSVLQKKAKNPDRTIFERFEFDDEQVVIKEGFVVVRPLTPVKVKIEGEESSPRENGCGVEVIYYLCPAESCDRVFLKANSTLTKHAIKCHLNDEKVLEKTYVWAKRKCSFCYRQIQFLQHYKDHMKLHFDPLPHFCYNLECQQRFLTLSELKDHILTHQPFRPQCSFAECDKLFDGLQGLHDHEWRHYVPAPQREDLEMATRHRPESKEAPWKQRVKVETLWMQNTKGQKEIVGTYVEKRNQTEDEETHLDDSGQNLVTDQNLTEKILPGNDGLDESKAAVNGYEPESSLPGASGSSSLPLKISRKKTGEPEPIDVQHFTDISTIIEGLPRNIKEPFINEHKTFKPEDPTYATLVKAPIVRPPPSTYLDESRLSMPKRRIDDECSVKKYFVWNCKKRDPDLEVEARTRIKHVEKVRIRCDKCLSSFGSQEELKKHQSLNNCSSLFGFDSDDES